MICVVAERAELLHVPDKILRKGLVKPVLVCLDSGALNGDLPSAGAKLRRTSVVSVKEIVWRELGACRGLEAAMFYPDDDDLALEAKSVCAGCDVRIACLEHALQAREKAGIWGGATERERRRMIRQRRRTA
jgi:WhiB family transcriptional regulator, redox-sensing transcriptional regulator